MPNTVPGPAHGHVASGFEKVAELFAHHLTTEQEIGASLAVYRGEELVVDLWGGVADVKSGRAWTRDTRLVVFSVTKGFAAMALNMAADRGLFEWEAPVVKYWPEFGAAGKATMRVDTLFGHRGGLAYLDAPLSLSDFTSPQGAERVQQAIEQQAPAWPPGESQGYHALTFGMYASAFFERVAGESIGTFLEREVFEPLQSDARLGTPASFDATFATLYPPPTASRVGNMVKAAVTAPKSSEGHVFRSIFDAKSVMRRAFTNPSVPRNDLRHYNDIPVRRAELAWGSATATAQGVARAYLPFANGGQVGDRRYISNDALSALEPRVGWSDHDLVLHKPLGWNRGFLKEETAMFSPNPESFGHAGMGGALGWADPKARLSIGYVMNNMDWRVRSPRAIALCHAIYASLNQESL